MIPRQFMGLATCVIAAIFMKFPEAIPAVQTGSLGAKMVFLGSLLFIALLGASSLLVKRNLPLKITMGTLNVIISGFWFLMFCGTLSFLTRK